ncbi:MAG: hypothetical protein LBS45_08210 [Synergistaceae bacterium]|jgi:hypothetical protein|nr:hypothetical protein [Synergistaceae bacterium]
MSMIKSGRAGSSSGSGGGSGGNDGCVCHEEITHYNYEDLVDAGTINPDMVYLIEGVPDITDSGGGAASPVSSVTVYPASATVQKGTVQIFNAAVLADGDGYVSQAVTWALTGNESPDTKVNGAGVLTVAADETATSLTITATSVVNNQKSGDGSVTVSDTAVTPSVTGIHVVPSGLSVERGNVQAFYVYWDAVGVVDRSIEWSIAGQISTGTYVTNTGLLRVAADESSPMITVTAESQAHSVNASGVAYVTAGDTTALDLLLELKEDKANKGAIGGYVPLGMNGKISDAYLPDMDTKFLGIFATLAALEALYPSPEVGDYAFVGTSSQTLYIWDGSEWSDTGEEGIPSGTFVERVNGKQGPNVNLGYGDVGAAPASHATDWAMHMTAAEKAKLAVLQQGSGGISEQTLDGVHPFAGSYARYKKYGRIVCLSCGINMSGDRNQGGDGTMFPVVVPNVYKPLYGTVQSQSAISKNGVRLVLSADAVGLGLDIYSPLVFGDTAYFNMSWISAS